MRCRCGNGLVHDDPEHAANVENGVPICGICAVRIDAEKRRKALMAFPYTDEQMYYKDLEADAR